MMQAEIDPRGHRVKLTLGSGAIITIREDRDNEEGNVIEIHESTYRHLAIIPGARNSIFLQARDPD